MPTTLAYISAPLGYLPGSPRPSGQGAPLPARSTIAGILGAALGVDRGETERLAQLAAELHWGVAILDRGALVDRGAGDLCTPICRGYADRCCWRLAWWRVRSPRTRTGQPRRRCVPDPCGPACASSWRWTAGTGAPCCRRHAGPWRWVRVPAWSISAVSAWPAPRHRSGTTGPPGARGLGAGCTARRHGVEPWWYHGHLRPGSTMIEFAMVLQDGTRTMGGLASVLAACADGTLLDLANLQQEWRPGVVAHLAALTCVLPRYAGALTAADAWQGALDQLLPGAAPGQWCFHPDGTDRKRCSVAGRRTGVSRPGAFGQAGMAGDSRGLGAGQHGRPAPPAHRGRQVQPVARRRLRAHR